MGAVILEALRNAVLITGLVVVMMMMIESLNIESRGMVFKGLKKTKFGQVVIASLLGSIPGCMGGFATVSLYTHRMFSFGALVAMMIASSGDEAFVMLAMIPDQALVLFAVLFVLAVVVGVTVDFVHNRIHSRRCDLHDHSECGADTDCHDGYVVHEHEDIATVSEKPCNDGDGTVCGCRHDQNHGTSVQGTERRGNPHDRRRHYGWKRMLMFVGLAVFIAALATGHLGHDHSAHSHHDHSEDCHVADAPRNDMVHDAPRNDMVHDASHDGIVRGALHDDMVHDASRNDMVHDASHDCIVHGALHDDMLHGHLEHDGHFATRHCEEQSDVAISHGIDLLSEDWMNVLFAGLSVIVLIVLLFASDHFVEEHMWEHIIKKHLPVIFAWTFGVLLVLGIGLQYVEIDRWISDNTVLMILLATLIGIIPESGPHMIFVTLFAAGVVPFPVLLASSISQDGHASIPLLAESRKSFVWAKLINCLVALLAGFGALIII